MNLQTLHFKGKKRNMHMNNYGEIDKHYISDNMHHPL